MPFFLPKTSHNVRSYLSDVEDTHFPAFAARHDQFVANATTHTGMLLDRFGRVGEDASRWGQRAVEGVGTATGLRVGEAVRKEQEKVEKVKERLERETQPAQVERVGYVVEQRPVAEVVVPVAPSPGRQQVKREV